VVDGHLPYLFWIFVLWRITRWFKYDRDWLCVNKSQFVPVIFEPPCTTYTKNEVEMWVCGCGCGCVKPRFKLGRQSHRNITVIFVIKFTSRASCARWKPQNWITLSELEVCCVVTSVKCPYVLGSRLRCSCFKKVKFSLEQAMKAQKGSRGIALLFL
jgi:hypothetical protein